MDIIVLTAMGFLLLVFILIFRKRHTYGVQRIMAANKNVKPLFKLQSARLKYEKLHHILQSQPNELQKLEQLHTDYETGCLNLEDYYNALDELLAIHNEH